MKFGVGGSIATEEQQEKVLSIRQHCSLSSGDVFDRLVGVGLGRAQLSNREPWMRYFSQNLFSLKLPS